MLVKHVWFWCEAKSVWKLSYFCREDGKFCRCVYRMRRSAPNSYYTLSSYFSGDIRQWFPEEFRGFAFLLLCLGVSWTLVEVDGQVLGSGFSAVSGRDWTKQFTMTRLAHYHSPTTVQEKSLKQSFVHFCLILVILELYQCFMRGDERNLLACHPDFRWLFWTTKKCAHYIEMT